MKKILLLLAFFLCFSFGNLSAERWEFVGSWMYEKNLHDSLELPLLFVDLDRIEVLEKNDRDEITSFMFKIAFINENTTRYMFFHTKEDPAGNTYLKKVSIYSVDRTTKKISPLQINKNAQFQVLDDTGENRLYHLAYFYCLNELSKRGH